MLNNLIVIVGGFLLIALLYYEKRRDVRGVLPTKTLLSSLFVLTALLQVQPIPSYYVLLTIGLLLCLGGDVFLALPQERMFLPGLISFLFGHIFYVVAFLSVSNQSHWIWAGFLGIFIMSGLVYMWLRPHLGSMKVPVLVYVIVISLMVCGALAVLNNPGLAGTGRIMAFSGALGFYLSDIFVARDRFLKEEFLNRSVGLPMYYTGQFLLAFSVGTLKWV
jgi:uncharacterized membrane protein YhhN